MIIPSNYSNTGMDYSLGFTDGYIKGREDARPKWIPCTETPHPDNPRRVQVQLDNGWIITAWWDGSYWFSVPQWDYTYVPIDCKVEAWCELPEPYKGDMKGEEK